MGIGWYFISGSLVKSLWFVFLGTFLFNTVAYDLIVPEILPYISGLLHQNEFSYAFYFYDLFLILILVYLKLKGTKVSYKWGWRDGLILGMTILGLYVTSIVGNYYNYAWYSLMTWFKYVVIFYVTVAIMSDREVLKPTLEIISVFALFNVILVIVQQIHGGPLGLAIEDMSQPFGRYADEIQSWYRPGGTSWNANLTSSILLMVFPLFNLLIIQSRKLKNKWWLWWIIVLAAVVIMASRYVWVLFALVLFLLHKKFFKGFVFPKWGWIVVAAAVPILGQRLSSLVNSSGFQYRLNHWYLTGEILARRPWGLGWDIFKYEIPKMFAPGKYFFDPAPPHNLFLEVFAGIGIGGGIMFVIFAGVVLSEIFRKRKLSDLNFVLWLSVAGYFLVNQMYSSLFSGTITGLFWIILGIFYATNYTKKN